MTAAARVLHHAIEDAVQQLEPQLLPLFNDGYRGCTVTRRETNGHEPPAARPTQRTHTALKMLVALTRFFPEDHRVRRAGQQLELIWAPLVHEPRGAAAGKLLHYYFRLRQDLLDTPELALRRAMHEEVRAAIDGAAHAGNYARIKACEERLCVLAGFLPVGSLDTARLGTLSPLARLLLWQQFLEVPASDLPERAAISPLLLPDMLTVLDRCITLCRASDWSLDYFCNAGLARGLWQLRGMAHFAGHAGMVGLFEELDDECLDMHLTGAVPPAGAMQRWLVRLFAVVHERNIVCPPPLDIASAPELPFRAIYDQELRHYRQQLQSELQGELPGVAADAAQQNAIRVSAPLITLLYKLTWVFAAAQQLDWARLCHCAYRVALQYWRLRRPVSATCHDMLRNLALKPGTLVDSSTLRHWRWQLLQDWPSWTGNTRRPIALRPEVGHVVALEAVPDLLSASFTTLVQAGRLTELPSATACQPHFRVLVQNLSSELLQELALLEKGAAAMKVWPLEQLCTLLIAVYETHLRDEVELPTALLQDAHRQLVRMLDQSAAWREATPVPALVQALELWLRDSREPSRSELLADGSDCEQTLRAYLLSCLGTLASVLERPVRLQLDVGSVRLDATRMMQVVDCLRPLIKFMLLDQSVDTRMRQQMHKPRISTVAVTLRAASARLTITAGEDGHEEVLSAAELQRLQRRLPKAAGPLACESRAGRGRSFTFTLD